MRQATFDRLCRYMELEDARALTAALGRRVPELADFDLTQEDERAVLRYLRDRRRRSESEEKPPKVAA